MTQVKEIGLMEAAQEALEKACGDVRVASRLMAQRVKDEEGLLISLVSEYLQSVYSGSRIAKRAAIWTAANYDPGGNGHRVRVLAAGNARMLLDFPLRSGKPLRHASKGEVRENAEAYYAQADDMRHKSRWLALVAAKVPDGKRVGDALSEKVLLELMEKAKHEKK